MEPIRCTFIYTSKEFRQALFSYMCLKGFRQLILVALVFYIFICGETFYSSYSSGDFPSDTAAMWYYIFYSCAINFLEMLVFFLFLTLSILFFQIRRFRGNPFFNKTLRYSLDEKVIVLESENFKSEFQWPFLSSAYERASGFMFFLGKSKSGFHWLPKNGFSSPEDIVRCRDLIQERVKVLSLT